MRIWQQNQGEYWAWFVRAGNPDIRQRIPASGAVERRILRSSDTFDWA